MRILILCIFLASCGSGDGVVKKPPVPVKAECKDTVVCPDNRSAGGKCFVVENPFCEDG